MICNIVRVLYIVQYVTKCRKKTTQKEREVAITDVSADDNGEGNLTTA